MTPTEAGVARARAEGPLTDAQVEAAARLFASLVSPGATDRRYDRPAEAVASGDTTPTAV